MAKPTKVPEWDSGEVNTVEPTVAHKASGWAKPGGVPEKPTLEEYNYWMNNVYKWLKEINESGMLKWDAATTYEIDSYVVGSDGALYIGLTATNLNNNPVGDPVNWFMAFSAAGITFDDSGTIIVASDVQTAIEELDTLIAGAAQRFTSGAFTLAANTIQTFVHGLSGTPIGARLIAKCITPEHGYIAGEYAFNLQFEDVAGAGSEGPVNLRVNATNIYFASGDVALKVVNQVAAANADWLTITPANWSLYLITEFE